jgi:hypothetical protein
MTPGSPVLVADRTDRDPVAPRDVSPPAPAARSGRMLRVIALIGLSAVITLTMQIWVGGSSVYAPELQQRRERLHEIIFYNRAESEAEFQALGVNTTNIRIGAVYLAEAIHRVTGKSISRVYRMIDTVALFAAIPLLFWLYRRGNTREHALLAMLYVSAILPLTYFLFYFHPWDRPMLVLWILMIACIQDDRPLLLGALLLISMVIKFDALFLPGLYFLVYARRDNLLPVTLRTGGLVAVTFGTYAVLRMIFPGGSAVGDPLWQIRTNFQHMADYNLGYPPLLGLGLPVLLAIVGWHRTDRFARASVLFAAGLSGIYFVNSNFAELRAMMPVVLLILPAALAGVRVLLSPPALVAAPARAVEPPRA